MWEYPGGCWRNRIGVGTTGTAALILSLVIHAAVLAAVAMMPTIQKEQVIDVVVLYENSMVQEIAEGSKARQRSPEHNKRGALPKSSALRQAVNQPGAERLETETRTDEAMVEQGTTALASESKARAASTEALPMVSGTAISIGSGSNQGSDSVLPGPLSSGGSSLQGGGQGEDMEFGHGTGPGFQHRVMPVYPILARKMGKEGRTILRLTIDEKGTLMGVEVVEDSGYGFADAALEAVRSSKFRPAVRDGKAVKSRALLPVRFVLRRS